MIERPADTELVSREHILSKAKQIADRIGNSEEVQLYQASEQKIQNHQAIQALIRTIKKKQKEAVAFEALRNMTMVAKIDEEIAELQAQLNSFPIVEQFQQVQEEINDVLQNLFRIMRDTVSEKVAVDEAEVETETSNCDL